jgi:hypothetical protein
MKWDEFVVEWSSTLNTGIPQEAIREWQRFVKSSDADAIKTAIRNVAEEYYRSNSDNKKSPTLFNLQKAYNAIAEENAKKLNLHGCDFCHDISGTVLVIDSGNYDPAVFPPDPETWNGRRSVCALPCPCCRANEYDNQNMRERVRKYAKPISQRNNLIANRG